MCSMWLCVFLLIIRVVVHLRFHLPLQESVFTLFASYPVAFSTMCYL